ncbi:MAG TPA: carboxylesterase/lipase family protein [Steroidobacteraceae bacterium]|nr:carboxylesterase/lipase family protein [Steroidobacteraceae bacterium]
MAKFDDLFYHSATGVSMINRRILTQGILGAGVAALTTGHRIVAQEQRQGEAVAKTTLGSIRGASQDGILSFLGVPYGAAPTGDLRFMPPRSAQPWTDVRDARAYGDTCPQIPLGLSPFVRHGDGPPPPPSPMQRQLGTLFTRGAKEPAQSEDCLVLNVWTRGLEHGRRPVMVWLHGGGFAVGSGSLPTYNGARLAARGDVVIVTINHRLNVFGHLYLGEIAGERFAQSANVGMLDILAALQWVRDNIAGFGGDPGNVTIFGESGGAGKVSVMCAMPSARGLFHKAIMQSGPCLQIIEKARGTAIARQLLQDLGLSPNQVVELQHMDAMKLAGAAEAAEVKVVPRILGFGPTGLIPLVDGVVLPHHPFDKVASPESAHVPFLVGSTKDEAVLFTGPLPRWGQFTDDELLALLGPIAGARSREALTLYRRLHPADSNSYLLADMVTDFWMRQAANHVAELKAQQHSAPAYQYVLEWEINQDLRTAHGTDVSLVFDNVAASAAVSGAPNAQAVSDQMSDAWLAFAKTGNPNHARLAHWPAYSLPARAMMLFNVNSHVIDDYEAPARAFWEAR